jgi:tetratricopeptide (TPR) repeat protein
MKALRVLFRLGLLIGLVIEITGLPATAQTTPPNQAQPPAPALLRKLTGDDARRAEELGKAIDAAWKADRWDEAIARAEELLALRARVQGAKHFETVNAEWRLKALHRVAPMPHEDRVAYQSAITMYEQATTLNAQGKYAAAQLLYEKALEIQRRLLTDDHPDTANSYNNLAANLNAQGKYAQAQPLYEKALEIRRRLLTDDHPDTAADYAWLAANLNAQGKYAQAQPLFEKALEIFRRLLTDDHPHTATSYNNLAFNLNAQGKYAQAQPLYEKALEIQRRLLTDDHPDTAGSYNNVAYNLNAQGKYAQAQPLFEKALEIRRRLLTDDNPSTAVSYINVAYNLFAQGKYLEARDQWRRAVKSEDKARLRVAFTGLERAGAEQPVRPALAAVLARLGQPAEAWQTLEEDLGRGLLDELAARQDHRLAFAERARLRELVAALERLDRLVETTPKDLEKTERAKRFEDLKRQRELASIALGELQTKLVKDHGALAGEVARLSEIQAALPADAALVAWVDIPPAGPNAADPDGEHWGVVVRSRGIPAWVPIAGTGPDGLWTGYDIMLAYRVRTELRRRLGGGAADLRPLVERLRTQRLEPLAKALAATAEGQPPARRLIVLPSRAMAGIPVEALLAPEDTRTVSYSPSATVFKYLRDQPRPDAMPACWPWATRSTSTPTARATPSRCPTTACWSTWWSLARTPQLTD